MQVGNSLSGLTRTRTRQSVPRRTAALALDEGPAGGHAHAHPQALSGGSDMAGRLAAMAILCEGQGIDSR